MNILIPHSWLKTLLETDKSARFIAEKLSLTGFSVERVEEVKNDAIYDIEITTNRPDGLSVLGVAREIYANFKFNNIPVKFKTPAGVNNTPKLETSELFLKVKLQKPELCPRFTAVILNNVTIKPSPTQIQKHLELAGIRALNNIVDISNYLMLELGQPVHTFDYDKIINANMILREAKDGEEITTLDGVKRKPPEGTIVIEDKGRLIDLAGIMGGVNSQISKKTKRVLVFVQTYDPVRIRKTTKHLSLRTEASARFEKGLDTEGVIPTLNRAVYLAKKLAGAKVASKVIDIYITPYKPKTVKLAKVKLDQYMGIDVPVEIACEILASLGFKTSYTTTEITAVVPSFRANDVVIAEDLIEEIARVWGYDKLPTKLPAGEIKPQTNPVFYWENRVKDYLKYQGFSEVVTYSMISKKDLEIVGITEYEAVKIRNPLNLDLEYIRPTLLPSLLKVAAANQSRGDNLRFFEFAARYEPKGDGKFPEEIPSLAGVVQTSNFYQVKGVLEGLFEDLGIDATFTQTEIPNLVSGQTAKITANGAELGRIGKINSKVLQAFGLDGSVFVFGFYFEGLANLAKLTKKYTPISKYPQVSEDVSMIVNENLEVGKILEVIQKAGGALLTKTEVFDIFEDAKLGQNKKSVAVHLTYQSQTHNLSSKEVETLRKKIISTLEKEIGAKVRLKES